MCYDLTSLQWNVERGKRSPRINTGLWAGLSHTAEILPQLWGVVGEGGDKNAFAALLSLVCKSKRCWILHWSAASVQLLLMPRCSCAALRNERMWLQNRSFIVYSRYKMSVAEISSPGKKTSAQWYIGTNEVRNLRITSSPKCNGLFHSFTDENVPFSSMIDKPRLPSFWYVYRRVRHQPQHVQPQTKGTLYIWQFAFIVITHWCEHRLKITNVALIRISFLQ